MKSFVGQSIITELEKAIGQYTLYRQSLLKLQSSRQLYLAMPIDAFLELSADKVIDIIQDDLEIKLLVYDPVNKKIEQWKH